jgi:hypothetical protein
MYLRLVSCSQLLQICPDDHSVNLKFSILIHSLNPEKRDEREPKKNKNGDNANVASTSELRLL